MSSEKHPEAALNLDIDQQQSFVRYYRQLPEKPQSTVRLFNRTDFYTVHEEDAVLASKFAPKIIKFMGNEPKLSYVCLSKHQMEQFARELLLVCQYRIEVYSKPPGKNNDWFVEFKGSPGNLSQFEDILFENVNIDFSNAVMGIKVLKNNVLAIGNVNLTDLKFEVCEIQDNDCFTELEALIAQVGPKECVLPSGDSQEIASLTTLLERNGVLVNKIKKADFNTKDILQDLNRLLFFHKNHSRNAETLPETSMDDCMSCLQAVIKFLSLTNSENNFNQYRLGKLDVNRFVRLDFAALNALNIVPKVEKDMSGFGAGAPKSHSIFGILNQHCVTAQGKRLLSQWIKQPLKDHNLINERLDIVECLVNDSTSRLMISKNALTKVPDLMILSKRLSGKKARLHDCYKVYQAINKLPNLVSILRKLDNKCVAAYFVDALEEMLSEMQKFQAMVEMLLDLDSVDKGEFLIKNTVNEEMNELYERKMKIEKNMHKVLKKAADELGLEDGKTIKLDSNPQYGHFFRITKKEEPILRKNKSFDILDTVTGGVRFKNSKLASLSDEYSEITRKYEESQKEIAEEMLSVAVGYTLTMRVINMLMAKLDVLTAFATAAVSGKMPYVRPKMKPLGSGVLKLEKVRHPCLEQQDHIAFIPNDVTFNKKDKIFQIITGPNMCGKSTYIRSIGVSVLMAQIGSFVPCDSAEIAVVDAILARVGADDCQLKGLSTFMLEMIEASTILKTATSNSLVIIDELGRGTSTYDGCGIAWAIAEHLAKDVKCFSLFATHFHKITKLADTCDRVGNLHVSAVTSENTITPLYTVQEGECDKSYGIHCAKLAEFPNDVIENAENELKILEHHEGLKYLQESDVATRKQAIEEGDRIIETTLKELAEKSKNLSGKELESLVESTKNHLMTGKNLFVKGLLE